MATCWLCFFGSLILIQLYPIFLERYTKYGLFYIQVDIMANIGYDNDIDKYDK